MSKSDSLWSKFQHASSKGVRPEIVNFILPVLKEVAPDGLGSGNQIEERPELVKRGCWQRLRKGSVKTTGETEMPPKWTTGCGDFSETNAHSN